MKLVKNALSRRDKTISETVSEITVLAVNRFSRKFTKARVGFKNNLFVSEEVIKVLVHRFERYLLRYGNV